MAPRAKVAGLVSLVESDSEPDFGSLDATGQVSPQQGPLLQKTTKPRGRPTAANRVTKTVRNGTRQATAKAVATRQLSSRRALEDKSNTSTAKPLMRPGKPSQDEDEISMVDQPETTTQYPLKTTRGRPPKTSRHNNGVASNPKVKSTSTTQSPCSLVDAPSLVDEIPETQNTSLISDQNTGRLGNMDEPSMPGSEHHSNQVAFEQDVDEVSACRRLLELRKRYEGLEMRYRNLEEFGVKAAEHNFERLKKQAEENTAAANKLISRLKEEVAAQSKMLQQTELLRQRLEHSEAEASALRVELSNARESLSEARCEIKTISAKLAASRTVEVNVKASSNGAKAVVAGNRTVETLQAAQAKEDLYGDLTGLIVRDVRRGDKEDIFDCIQTGRNGTLHFKLSLERMDATENYEDVQFTYRPQLDASRDGDLMDVLPDYLTEEITFPRPHASKFYTRVTKSLMERLD